MGLHLVSLLAEGNWFTQNADWLWAIAQGILGLGFVIFVHELGHFAVAKMCGVKCEKFYLGFDIGGYKLAKFQWGETEYGIGVLPLGGYVKMLGQDDNPGRAAEERRRSTLTPQAGEEEGHAQTLPGLTHSPTPVDAPLDPRSYMAKSVPQRMAIISAGVIMNVIFAFLMAAWAFWLGVPEITCAVSGTIPGAAGWRAGLQPGDRILQINDRESTKDLPLRFTDLREAVTLSDGETGVRFLIQRDGVEKPMWITITPDAAQAKFSLAPMIGAVNPNIPVLRKTPAMPGSPADKVDKFKGGDKIVKIDGEPIEKFEDIQAALARKASKPLTFTVERKVAETPSSDQAEKPKTEQLDVTVPPRPRRWLGLVMRLGKVTAIQDNSPAAAAGLQVDDFIVSIDGQSPGDINVMSLPELFRSKAGETVKLEVSRKNPTGQDATVKLDIVPRDPAWYEPGSDVPPGTPLSIPALGAAVKVLNVVQSTEPDSPAANAIVKMVKTDEPAQIDRISPRDEIVKVEVLLTDPKDKSKTLDPVTIEFMDEEGNPLPNWPYLIDSIQDAPDGSKVKLFLRDKKYVELTPADSPTDFNPDRGFVFEPEYVTYQAKTVGQAFSMAATQTQRALLQVYSFLKRIGDRRISPFALGGPLTIFDAAAGAAEESFSKLLLFLTMLSANLAVINFLPIPVLDGGHMVFLALEGIMRRPVSERVVIIFQYVGLLFIVGLMLFVLGLDLRIIPRF